MRFDGCGVNIFRQMVGTVDFAFDLTVSVRAGFVLSVDVKALAHHFDLKQKFKFGNDNQQTSISFGVKNEASNPTSNFCGVLMTRTTPSLCWSGQSLKIPVKNVLKTNFTIVWHPSCVWFRYSWFYSEKKWDNSRTNYLKQKKISKSSTKKINKKQSASFALDRCFNESFRDAFSS